MWMRPTEGGLKITKQALLRGETVTGDRQGFTDLTVLAGLDFRGRHNPLFDTPEWDPKTFGIVRYASAGVSAADYDNDGKLDLYIGRYLDPRKNLPTTLFYTRNSEGNTL